MRAVLPMPVLVCNATSGALKQGECPTGATCKLLTEDTDPCDNGKDWPTGAHPCQKTGTCGLCTFP